MSSVDLKICFLSVIAAIFIVSFVLTPLAIMYFAIRRWIRTRRFVRQLRAYGVTDHQTKEALRRKKAREARRTMQDEVFSREMWEILK